MSDGAESRGSGEEINQSHSFEFGVILTGAECAIIRVCTPAREGMVLGLLFHFFIKSDFSPVTDEKALKRGYSMIGNTDGIRLDTIGYRVRVM